MGGCASISTVNDTTTKQRFKNMPRGGGARVIKVPTKAAFDKAIAEAGDTLIAVDFTATWCGPCRHISPVFDKLATRNPDCIFLKVDVDQNSETSTACGISCMPTFQFYKNGNKVDEFSGADEGKLTTKVKQLIYSKQLPAVDPAVELQHIEVANTTALAVAPKVEALLGTKFIGGDGTAVGKEALAGKIVGLYFSAHWCPPCRGFTPKLTETYNRLQTAGKPFEIVFCSSDQDEGAFAAYHKSMPWLALPFEDRKRKADLCSAFNVSGIPALVIIDTDGTVIAQNARAKVGNDPQGTEFPWR